MSVTGERMQERRKELGISADALAEYLGVSRSTVFRYENGDIEKVPANRLTDIAKFLKTSEAFLMGWEDKIQSIENPPKIIQYYDQLNDIGKHEAEKRVEELTHLPKYTKEGDGKNNTVEFSEELIPTKDYLLPNAAHADESLTEITEEMIQEENDIMDNL